jgi:hypothetical protein
MYSPSFGLPTLITLPRVPAATAADADRITTRGFSPAFTFSRRDETSSSLSGGGVAAVRRVGTQKS